MILARSVLFTALMFLSVIYYASMVVILSWRGAAFVYRYAAGWARFNLRSLRILCRLDYTVEGAEHILQEPCILYWKHQSVFEIMASAVIFPRQTWVAKRELLWIPFFGWGFARLKPIAIDRGAGRTAVRQVMSQGTDRLREGLSIVIFPEGTRVLPGQSRRYGVSGAALACRSGCPLVPVAHNAGDYWPRRGWMKRPGTIRVVIGPPIRPDGRDPGQLTAEASAWIEAEMCRISPAHQPGEKTPLTGDNT